MVLDILSLVVAFVNDGGMNVTQTRGFWGQENDKKALFFDLSIINFFAWTSKKKHT